MAPAAMNIASRQGGARRMQIPGGVRVTHSELLADIGSNVNFTAISLQVNPGLASFSPWLSAESQNFDQYRLVAFEAEYRPTCGTGNTGAVMVAYDYNPTDALPVTRQDLSTYLGAVDGAPWVCLKTQMSPAAVHGLGPRKFLRFGPVSGDIRVYDAGQLIVSTSGGPAVPVAWGELWCHYTFDLLVQTSPTFPLSTQLFGWTNGVAQIIGPTANADVIWGVQLANFHNSVGQNPTQTIFTMSEMSTVIWCNLQITSTVPLGLAQVTVSLRINGLALISQFATFQANATANQVQSINFAYPASFPPGATVDIYVQNPSASSTVTITPGAAMNFLCV
jgi:hypothetical protein